MTLDEDGPPPAASGAPGTFLPPGMTQVRARIVLIGSLLTMILAILDQNIVTTAAWAITRDLDAAHGLDRLPWLVTAYLVASTATQPLYGKLTDVHGPRKVFLFAVGLFLTGSMLCGLAQNMVELIVLRFVQGLGGGGLMSITLVIAARLAPPDERAKKAGMGGILIALGTLLGPLVGGYITEHLSWHWVFYVNVPLGAAAFIAVATSLRLPSEVVPHRIDYLGAVLAAAGASAILLVTELGGNGEYAWSDARMLALMAASAVLLSAFVWRQAATPEPLFPLALLRNAVFRIASPLIFVSGFAMMGSVVYVVLYMQIVQGVKPTAAGLHLLPMALGLMVTSIVTGRLIARLGRYRWFLVVGFGAAALGTALLAALDVDASWWALNGGLLLLGAGLGPTMQITILAVQNAVPVRSMGVATSSTTFSRTIGAAVGTAVLGALLTRRFDAGLDRAASVHGRPTAAMLHALPADVRDHVLKAFVSGTSAVFVVATVILTVAFVLAFFIREVPLEDLDEDAPAAGAAREARQDAAARPSR
ncbi:MDR family MFS transporter [Actinomadura formosensis]|uniref:MDR family MFS transporter n=1 Tax=Actinomadura formosensis TaxID=60706 RepID=UPI000AFB2319|nr:MDR family MFS transporter [Actinomadura formosensis]